MNKAQNILILFSALYLAACGQQHAAIAPSSDTSSTTTSSSVGQSGIVNGTNGESNRVTTSYGFTSVEKVDSQTGECSSPEAALAEGLCFLPAGPTSTRLISNVEPGELAVVAGFLGGGPVPCQSGYTRIEGANDFVICVEYSSQQETKRYLSSVEVSSSATATCPIDALAIYTNDGIESCLESTVK